MVLEASRQHNQALHNISGPVVTRSQAMKAENREKCEHCGSAGHCSAKCFIEHPELAPDWFKKKMEQGKNKGKNGEQARKF